MIGRVPYYWRLLSGAAQAAAAPELICRDQARRAWRALPYADRRAAIDVLLRREHELHNRVSVLQAEHEDRPHVVACINALAALRHLGEFEGFGL